MILTIKDKDTTYTIDRSDFKADTHTADDLSRYIIDLTGSHEEYPTFYSPTRRFKIEDSLDDVFSAKLIGIIWVSTKLWTKK